MMAKNKTFSSKFDLSKIKEVGPIEKFYNSQSPYFKYGFLIDTYDEHKNSPEHGVVYGELSRIQSQRALLISDLNAYRKDQKRKENE